MLVDAFYAYDLDAMELRMYAEANLAGAEVGLAILQDVRSISITVVAAGATAGLGAVGGVATTVGLDAAANISDQAAVGDVNWRGVLVQASIDTLFASLGARFPINVFAESAEQALMRRFGSRITQPLAERAVAQVINNELNGMIYGTAHAVVASAAEAAQHHGAHRDMSAAILAALEQQTSLHNLFMTTAAALITTRTAPPEEPTNDLQGMAANNNAQGHPQNHNASGRSTAEAHPAVDPHAVPANDAHPPSEASVTAEAHPAVDPHATPANDAHPPSHADEAAVCETEEQQQMQATGTDDYSASDDNRPHASDDSTPRTPQNRSLARVGTSVARVNGRRPGNSRYANGNYPASRLPASLRARYPNGIPFTADGFPNFASLDTGDVLLVIAVDGLNGDHGHDVGLAEAAARAQGFNYRPSGQFTWHHHQDSRTMILMRTDLHDFVKHSGGAAALRALYAWFSR